MRKILGLLFLTIALTGCALGGEEKRREEIPPETKLTEFLEDTLGLKDAEIVAAYNLLEGETPPDDRTYYAVDALYLLKSESRGIEFEVRWEYNYDNLFGSGYHYFWSSNYDRVALEDYLENNPLPAGVEYDTNRGYNSRYNMLDGHEPMIYFECEDKRDFERYVDDLEDWLKDWMKYEHKFLTNKRTLSVRVVFEQLPSEGYDDGLLGSVQVGEKTGNATPETFKRKMRKEYESRKKLDRTD